MQESSYRPSNIRSIILGIIAFTILLLTFCGLSEVIKAAGSPFLILPQQIGAIPKVTRADVQTYSMQDSPVQFNFQRTGEYAVYTNDIDLLMTTDQIIESNGNPWINIIEISNGQKLDVNFVSRGMFPFDSALAKGRPVFIFKITNPGIYQLSFPRRYATIFILPNNTFGYEGRILFFVIVQLLIIAYPIFLILRKMFRKRQAKISEIRGLKKKSDQEFWETLKQQRETQQGKPKHNDY